MICPAHHFDAMIGALERGLRPPPRPLTLVERAAAMQISEGLPGDEEVYDLDSHPAQRMALAAIGSRRWRTYVFPKPVQDGGTLATVVIPLAWALMDLAEPVFLMEPDEKLLGKLWRNKIRPTFFVSGFADRFPRSGPGSDDGVPIDVGFARGGHLYLAGSGSSNEGAQAMVTTRWVIIDEADKVRRRQMAAAKKRTESFDEDDDWNHILVSTISKDSGSPTLETYELSTEGHIQVAFPCCGRYQPLEWDQVDVDSERIACKHCGELHADATRRRAIRTTAREVHRGQRVSDDGTIIGDLPAGRIYGLRWSALDSPRRGLGKLCAEYREANEALERHADPEGMRQFYRDQLSRPYQHTGHSENATREYLERRSAQSDYERGQVPEWATHLVLATDEQLRRCYWVAWAGAADGRRALVDWGEPHWARGDQQPTDAMRHGVLDELYIQATTEGWARADGEVLQACRSGIDIGYNYDGSVGRWVYKHPGVIAVRGDRERGVKEGSRDLRQYVRGLVRVREQSKPAPEQPKRWWFITTSKLWDVLRLGWLRGLDQPASFHLPKGCAANAAIVRHLASRQVIEQDDGTSAWADPVGREDYLDCVCYAEALLAAHFEILDKKKKRKPRRYGVVGTIGV